MCLTFLRHTQPKIAAGVCYGRTDLELAETFAQDALAVKNMLKPWSELFTSPLKRCRKLADSIGENSVLEGLSEMDFGTWERVPWSDVPRPELDQWAADLLHARPHGGESVAQMRDRVATCLADVPDGALLVTHHGVIKAAASLFGHPDGLDVQVGFGQTLTLKRP